MTDVDASWPHGSQDPIGQAGEFLVWAPLITQSLGGLHVFLPELDRGLDAVAHRLDDGAYLALQVKTKTYLNGPEAVIAVYEPHLFTPDQLVIGVHLDGDHLGPFVLVANTETFKRKAARIVDRGRMMLVADMPIRPIQGHSWSEDLVPLDNLAERLGGKKREPALALDSEPVSDEDRLIGYWGEQEVKRRLAFLEDCGLFRPFPDNEANEILIRRLATGATIGIQVKTAQLSEPDARRTILVNRSSFVPAPTTFVVAVAWMVPERRFHETCLVIPGDAVPALSSIDGPNYKLHFRPAGSDRHSRLDRYRVSLESLGETFAKKLDADQAVSAWSPGTPS
ncbi:MAG: hypothetical protein ACYDAL_05050 [Candidatus Dormibacteraceae bacterium]